MGLFRKLFEKRSAVMPAMTRYVINNGVLIPNKPISAEKALKNSDLYSAVALISSDLAGADFLGDNPAVSLLNHPIPHLNNRYNFWQTVILNLLLNGNAFVQIERDVQGAAVQLRHIPLSAVSIDLTYDNLTYQVQGYDDFTDETISHEDMLHFRIMAYGDNSGIYDLLGRSPLEALTSELTLQDASNKLAISTTKRGIYPTNVIKVPNSVLSYEAKESVRKEFEQANSGENAGRPAVMDASAEFSQISINADIAKFLSNLDWNKKQIAKVFGIPSSFLEGTGDEQSSLEMTSELYVNGLNRYIEPILAELTQKLGDDIRFDKGDIMDYSRKQLHLSIKDWVDQNIITPQEARELLIRKGVLDLYGN